MPTWRDKTVLLGLTPSGVELIHRYGSARAERRCLDLSWPTEPERWGAAVAALAPELTRAVTAAGLCGSRAVVLYSSPFASSQHISLASPTKRQAVAGAMLSCVGATPYGAASSVSNAAYLGSDRIGDPPQRHVVAVADRIDAAEALVNLVESAGLHVNAMAPVEAVSTVGLVEMGLATAHSIAHGWLYLGVDHSCLVVVKDGCVVLTRQIGLGTRHVIDALTRPIRSQETETPVELTRSVAIQILSQCGIPDRHDKLGVVPGLTGAQILPLVQPVLQRIIVELKQSLRFGLDDADREELKVTLLGPGASISGLSTLLGESIAGELTPAPVRQGRSLPRGDASAIDGISQAVDPTLTSELLSVVPFKPVARAQRLNLIPPRVLFSQVAGSVQRGLIAGAVAAAALIGAEMMRLDGEVAESDRQLNIATQRHDKRMQALQRIQEVANLSTAATNLAQQIHAIVGTGPDWASVMRELARLTPSTIALESVDGGIEPSSSDASGPNATLEVRGWALTRPDDGDDVSQFLEALQGSSLIDTAVLGAVERSELQGRSARRFTVELSLTSVTRPCAASAGVGTASSIAAVHQDSDQKGGGL